MLRKKQIMCGILAVIMGVSMTGCGSSGEKSETEKKADEVKASGEEETIVLRILENDTAKSEGYLDELLEAFNKEYEGQIQAVDANMEEYSNLAENGPYGYGPDVIYQANDKLMTYAEDKHILALNKEDYDCREYIPQEAWDAFTMTIDGTQYLCGIPVNVQEPMLYYRKDLLPENWEQEWDQDGNQVPDFLENWNDLYAYSKSIVEESGNSKWGLVAPCNDLYMSAGFLFSYGAYVFGEDTKDIGFAAGDAATGMMALRQFAGIMNEECIDDSIKQSRYSKVADGTYFCSISTPDTYVLFHDRLAKIYEEEGISQAEADQKASENIGMVELPRLLPAKGDLSVPSADMEEKDWVSNVVMGGVNGYGISAYTKHREACVTFVNFATGYDLVKKRAEILGIAPTRSDVASDIGGVSGMIFESLNEGHIYLMPSVKAVDQIWDPMQTLLSDVAKDAFRERNGETVKYPDQDAMQAALEKVSKNIYDAIYTLAQ